MIAPIAWTRANTPVWALVSGLPSPARERRQFVMLQGYIDETGNDGISPAFVLGGFISTAEKWAAFSDEWQQYLEFERRISYFKMSEAANLSGEFSGWTELERDRRLKLLTTVVLNHVISGVVIVVPISEFNRIYGKDPYWKSLYNLSVYKMMGEFNVYQREFGLNEPINYIFDRQVMHEDEVRDFWYLYKELSVGYDHSLIGKEPRFEDEQEFLPLQAADMLVWMCRRRYEESLNPKMERYQFHKLASETRIVNIRQFNVTEEGMRLDLESIWLRRARYCLGTFWF